MERNKEVLEANAELRRKYDVLEQSEHELARRNMVYQKTIKTLVRAGLSLLHIGFLQSLQCCRCSACAHAKTLACR